MEAKRSMQQLFTCQSVSEGNADKICDQISDAVVDAVIERDPRHRVACEVFCRPGRIVVSLQTDAPSRLDISGLVRQTLRNIGYTDPEFGLDARTCGVFVSRLPVLGALLPSEPSAAEPVSDQTRVYGYACDETSELMPAPVAYANALLRRMAFVRRQDGVKWLRPDGLCQVTAQYGDGDLQRIDAIHVATQHDPGITPLQMREVLMNAVIQAEVPARLLDSSTRYFFNPGRRWHLGGPAVAAGLTGRRVSEDTYGGQARWCAGPLSGVDPLQLRRTASYFARYVAKNVVAARLARRCELALEYAIGVEAPADVCVDTFATGAIPDDRIRDFIVAHFDMTPSAMRDTLELLRPRYQSTSAYGHFGRGEFSWERTDRAREMASELRPPGR
jgi:S-adenosylmethionine synthetase